MEPSNVYNSLSVHEDGDGQCRVDGVKLIHFGAKNPNSGGTFEEMYVFDDPDRDDQRYYNCCYVEDNTGRTVDYIYAGRQT